mgnify:CR=1 FL=1
MKSFLAFGVCCGLGVASSLACLAGAQAAENWSRYNSSAIYPNPDQVVPGILSQAWTKTPCRDPWINIAYIWVMSRTPRGYGDLGECNPALYVGARWNNYNQLAHGIAQSLRALETSNLLIYSIGNTSYIKAIPSGINAALVAQGGGNLVAQGGGNLITKGGAKAYRLQSSSGYYLRLSGDSVINFTP